MEQTVKPWMYRKKGEYLALLISLSLALAVGIVFSLIDMYLSVVVLLGVVLYIQFEQARYLGNSLRVHSRQFPEIFAIFRRQAEQLQIRKANLYINQDPYLNAHTLGLGTCSVVLSSALVEQLSLDELSFVIGHELGHYQAGHTKISSLFIPLNTNNIVSTLIFGLWQRKAEYTSDQCGLVLTKNIDAAIDAMIKLAVGGNLAKKVDVEGYISQIKKADTLTVNLSEYTGDHPLITNRVRNLLQYWRTHFSAYEVS